MTDEQFSLLMQALAHIDEKLGILVRGAQSDRNSMDDLIKSLTQEEKPSTDAYFSQRLMGGPGAAGWTP